MKKKNKKKKKCKCDCHYALVPYHLDCKKCIK